MSSIIQKTHTAEKLEKAITEYTKAKVIYDIKRNRDIEKAIVANNLGVANITIAKCGSLPTNRHVREAIEKLEESLKLLELNRERYLQECELVRCNLNYAKNFS